MFPLELHVCAHEAGKTGNTAIESSVHPEARRFFFSTNFENETRSLGLNMALLSTIRPIASLILRA